LPKLQFKAADLHKRAAEYIEKIFNKPIDSSVYTVYTQYIQYIRRSFMDILISNASGQPIYDQIYTQVKNMILSGSVPSGEALPSIRSLAKDLRISVITTKRAYEELERDGYIYTVAGKGCFVSEQNMELVREENLRKIEEYMEKISQLAKQCSVTGEQLVEMFRLLNQEE
jgi:GntR family transcriptional regulator